MLTGFDGILLIKETMGFPWPAWLSWLEHWPVTKTLQVQSPVQARGGGNQSMGLCLTSSLKAKEKCLQVKIKKKKTHEFHQ